MSLYAITKGSLDISSLSTESSSLSDAYCHISPSSLCLLCMCLSNTNKRRFPVSQPWAGLLLSLIIIISIIIIIIIIIIINIIIIIQEDTFWLQAVHAWIVLILIRSLLGYAPHEIKNGYVCIVTCQAWTEQGNVTIRMFYHAGCTAQERSD